MSQRATIYSWQQAICQSDLMPTTRLVLLTLGTFMNQHGESCYPSIETIADCSGLSKRAVITHLDKAETAGFLTVKSHGFRGQKWKRNEYSASFPDKKGGERPAPRHEKGGEPHSKGGEPNDTKAVNEVHQDKNNPVNNPRTSHSAGERERTVEHNTPPSPDEGDAKAIWTEYAPKLIEVLGETKVELIGDRSRFAKAVLNSPGWTARQVAEAILAHCRAEASDQDERKYRKALHKILMAGTWQAKLGQTAPEAHEIEDLVAMTERQTREGLEAYKRKLEAREAA